MIKLEFKLSTLLLSALLLGFVLGLLIMSSLLTEMFSYDKIKLNQAVTELKIENSKLQGKVDSDLRLLQELRRKHK